jgi:hypothetical protein
MTLTSGISVLSHNYDRYAHDSVAEILPRTQLGSRALSCFMKLAANRRIEWGLTRIVEH